MSLSTRASSVNALYTTRQCGGRSCNKPSMKERKNLSLRFGTSFGRGCYLGCAQVGNWREERTDNAGIIGFRYGWLWGLLRGEEGIDDDCALGWVSYN
jgi:hypothetical protein